MQVQEDFTLHSTGPNLPRADTGDHRLATCARSAAFGDPIGLCSFGSIYGTADTALGLQGKKCCTVQIDENYLDYRYLPLLPAFRITSHLTTPQYDTQRHQPLPAKSGLMWEVRGIADS